MAVSDAMCKVDKEEDRDADICSQERRCSPAAGKEHVEAVDKSHDDEGYERDPCSVRLKARMVR